MSLAGTAVVAAVTLVVLGATVGGIQYAGGPSLVDMLQAGWGVVLPVLQAIWDLLQAIKRDLEATT